MDSLVKQNSVLKYDANKTLFHDIGKGIECWCTHWTGVAAAEVPLRRPRPRHETLGATLGVTVGGTVGTISSRSL